MAIWVDDEMVYLTNDPQKNWHAPQLRFRRVRPMVESTVRKEKARNRWGLSRYVVEAARADFPEASQVRLEAIWARFPNGKPTVHHTISAQAPEWELEMPK